MSLQVCCYMGISVREHHEPTLTLYAIQEAALLLQSGVRPSVVRRDVRQVYVRRSRYKVAQVCDLLRTKVDQHGLVSVCGAVCDDGVDTRCDLGISVQKEEFAVFFDELEILFGGVSGRDDSAFVRDL